MGTGKRAQRERQYCLDRMFGHSGVWLDTLFGYSTDTLWILDRHSLDTLGILGRHSLDTQQTPNRHPTDTLWILNRHSLDTLGTLNRHSTHTLWILLPHSWDTQQAHSGDLEQNFGCCGQDLHLNTDNATPRLSEHCDNTTTIRQAQKGIRQRTAAHLIGWKNQGQGYEWQVFGRGIGDNG